MEREEVEDRVLVGLKDRLLAPDRIAEFVTEYRKAFNELRSAERAAKATKTRELAKVQKQLDGMVAAVCNGMYHPTLEARKATLKTELETEEDEPIRLHPGLSDVYREKVANLTDALNSEETRAQAIRELITEIRMVPQEDRYEIEIVGELAAIMQLSENQNPQGRGLGGEISMVAGVGFEPTTFRL